MYLGLKLGISCACGLSLRAQLLQSVLNLLAPVAYLDNATHIATHNAGQSQRHSQRHSHSIAVLISVIVQVIVTVTAASCFMATVMSVAVPLTVAATVVVPDLVLVVVPDLVRAAFARHGLPDLLHRQWTTPIELRVHGD